MATTVLEKSEAQTAEEAKATAQRIAIALRENAAEAEFQRRVPDDSLKLVRDAGLLKTIQPKRAGGHELSMRAHVDVVASLAEGCGSTAWVAGVAHAHSWVLGHFPEQALQDAYADPNALVAAVIGPRGTAQRLADGSYTVSGFWPFGSGCQHSDWLLLGAELADENGETIDAGDFLVPTGDVTIRDDWHVAGLQGTGSNSIVAENVKVPAHRFLSLEKLFNLETPGLEGYDGWLYRAEAVPVLALCITGSAVGMARTALQEFLKIIPGKAIAYTDYIQDQWGATHMKAGQAASLIDAGGMCLYRVADDIDRFARAGDRMPMAMRARIRMDCAQGVKFCMDGVDMLFHGAGGSALSLRSSLQRIWRDIHAINMHGLLSFDASSELYGRVLAGLEPNTEII